MSPAVSWGLVLASASLLSCDTPHTEAVLTNAYNDAVVYAASWSVVKFPGPLAPGASTEAQTAIAASANTAYAVLAIGWDPASPTPPTSLVVVESASGYDLHWDSTLTITASDEAFVGHCGASPLMPQADADFITQRIFPELFAGHTYDASTCTTSP
jgi:hypothetical protein